MPLEANLILNVSVREHVGLATDLLNVVTWIEKGYPTRYGSVLLDLIGSAKVELLTEISSTGPGGIDKGAASTRVDNSGG